MDITDAFNASRIAEMGTDLTESEESSINSLLDEIWDGPLDESVRNLALLAFVAGRTHAAGKAVINVPMNPELIAQFMDFLSGRADD
jgi:hypothetical protein